MSEAMKTALLQGGSSPEREVSLASAAGVHDALAALGVPALRVDPAECDNWLQTLLDNNIGRVFNILHGGSGENGEVRAALNAAGIACTGAGAEASALAMNKHLTKLLWQTAGIPVAGWRLAASAEDAAAIAAALPPPWFVKPAGGGSSTHAAAAETLPALEEAIAAAAAENSGVMVEQLIRGEEYTLSIVGDEPLPLIKITPAQPFYDYHAKYVSDQTRFDCPCGLPAAEEQRLAELGMAAFRALGGRHWGRVDFMLTAGGQPRFLEVNTVPGMTSHSLVPLAARRRGMDYTQTVAAILASAGAD